VNEPPRQISLVFPVYNEQETLPFLRESVDVWRRNKLWLTEVILVDDGSRDRSWMLLEEWAKENPMVKPIRFSRNFGHQAALTAGLHQATGDVVAILDADLQDPLDVVDKMVAKFEEGFDVVSGQRIRREGETIFKRATAWIFYRLIRGFVLKSLPSDVGDFRLVSRRCLNALLEMNELHRFLRGMFMWVGFSQTIVQYERSPRKFGSTKYPFWKMVRFAWHAALSFSIAPIRLIAVVGALIACFGVAYGGYSVIRHFVWRDTVPGWTTIIVLLAIIGGANLAATGILGEYVGRIYEEAKRRPLYIIQEARNQEIRQHGYR
jgi:dolichol-phosphate mannosyltransferase